MPDTRNVICRQGTLDSADELFKLVEIELCLDRDSVRGSDGNFHVARLKLLGAEMQKGCESIEIGATEVSSFHG
jgi:hypothetical protein